MYAPNYANCIVFAIINFLLYGGKIAVCRWLPIPHFMWIDTAGHMWSYAPTNKYNKGNKNDFNIVILFKGAPVRRYVL